jgi:hypothetical protein
MFSTILSKVGGLPDVDLQGCVVLDGIIPWLMFPILWRYFRDNGRMPNLSLVLQIIPAVFLGFLGFVAVLSGFPHDYPVWPVVSLLVALLFVGLCLGLPKRVRILNWIVNHIIGPLLFGCVARLDNTKIWLMNRADPMPDVFPPDRDACPRSPFRHDHFLYHVVSTAVNAAFGVAFIFWCRDADAIAFPVSGLVMILEVIFVYLAVCHLLILIIFVVRRTRSTDTVRDFLGDYGFHTIYLWAVIF